MRAISEEWRFPGQCKSEGHSLKKKHGIILRTDLIARKGGGGKGMNPRIGERDSGWTKVAGLTAQT